MSTAAEILERDHVELDKLFADVGLALDSRDIQQIHDSIDLFWARLGVHIRAEHLVLFPAILRSSVNGEDPLIAKVISRLRDDHDVFMKTLASVMKRVRLRSADDSREPDLSSFLKKSFVELSRHLEEHNRIEEASLYSLPAQSTDNNEELARQIKEQLTNLPDRFRVSQK